MNPLQRGSVQAPMRDSFSPHGGDRISTHAFAERVKPPPHNLGARLDPHETTTYSSRALGCSGHERVLRLRHQHPPTRLDHDHHCGACDVDRLSASHAWLTLCTGPAQVGCDPARI